MRGRRQRFAGVLLRAIGFLSHAERSHWGGGWGKPMQSEDKPEGGGVDYLIGDRLVEDSKDGK